MNKKLLISMLSVLVISSAVVMAEDTTGVNAGVVDYKTSNTFTERPDFVKGQRPQGPPPQMNGESGQQGQFEGKRPSKRPDAKPGGDRKPPEWDSSNNNGENVKGRPPLPPDQDKSSDSTES